MLIHVNIERYRDSYSKKSFITLNLNYYEIIVGFMEAQKTMECHLKKTNLVFITISQDVTVSQCHKISTVMT